MATDSPICTSLEMTFDLDTVGLVGGDYESEPSVHSWTSFNPHRIIRSYKLDEVRPMNIPDNNSKGVTSSVYSNTDREHLFNGEAYHWFMGNESTTSPLYSIGADDSEAAPEKLDFHVPQNNGLFRTKEPIIYDLSDPAFHGHLTMRTDASVWLKLMAVSLFSGVPKIDETDRVFTKVRRGAQVGVCQLQLCDLYREAAATINHSQTRPGDVTFSLESAFVDPKLMNIEMTEIAERYTQKHKCAIDEVPREVELHIIETAFLRTRKAIIIANVTLRQFDFNAYRDSHFSLADLKTSPLNTYMQMRGAVRKSATNNTYSGDTTSIGCGLKDQTPLSMKGRTSFSPILYNSLPGMNEIRSNMDYVIRVYCGALVPIDEQGCLYQAMNPNVAKLHLPQFIGEQGKTPVVAFFGSRTPYTREYTSEEARRIEQEIYDYDDTTEELLTLMLRSSLRRHGMSKDLFMSTIKTYFSKENTSEVASGLFVTAMKVIADAATFAANSIYYTADFRYQKLDRNAEKLMTQIRTKEAHYKKINLDSFDSNQLNGTSGAGDCEDASNVACVILTCFGHGRYKLKGKWRSALLNCMKSVVDRMVVFAVGATVTSAYVDNDNKPIDMKEENKELPIIGDKIDVNSQCDGHCFGIMMIDAVVDQLLTNGNLTPQVLKSVREQWNNGGSFSKRDYTVPALVLEGTGSVEPTLLPVDEVFDHPERRIERIQARGEISFLKEVKARFNEDKIINKDVMEMFSGEGCSFYVDKQDIKRRVSRFYREIIHGISLSLYSKNEMLSQIVFCKKVHTGRGGANAIQYAYGVNTGELLRSGMTMNKEIALIAPFKDIGREWREKARPIIECVENQMPIMQFGHYTKEQFKEWIYSRYMKNTNSLGDNDGSLIQSLLEKVAGNPELTIIRLQSREWKLTDKVKVEKLNKFFMSFPRVVAHGFFAEKHILPCDAIVEILLVVKC